MKCKNCNSEKIASVNAKCGDMCHFEYDEIETNDYAPSNMGIGGGDYIKFNYCLECGQIQGNFPIEINDENYD